MFSLSRNRRQCFGVSNRHDFIQDENELVHMFLGLLGPHDHDDGEDRSESRQAYGESTIALGIQAQNLVIHRRNAGLAFLHELRLKTALPISGCF